MKQLLDQHFMDVNLLIYQYYIIKKL